jgi:hypothetical protein
VTNPGLNVALGLVGMTLIVIVGCFLLLYGLMAGVLKKRLAKPYRRGEYYEGRAAVVEGILRMVVGGALVALVIWIVS